MLRGTGVSEGCGIGKALIIQHRSLDYSGVVFGGAQQEKERLRAAINAFMQKTEQLRDRLQASAGEKEAAILDGHMEMLRDPFMLSQMEEMIDGGATAEAAADGVCNQFIAMFSGMDDELTRQRASDIADVREDLLGIMLGAEQVDLGAIEPGTVLVAHDFTPSMTGKMNRRSRRRSAHQRLPWCRLWSAPRLPAVRRRSTGSQHIRCYKVPLFAAPGPWAFRRCCPSAVQ